MRFHDAVQGTSEIAAGLKAGLQAVTSAHRSSISAGETRRITGSVDIDAALEPLEPHANRWDYAIGYRITSRQDKVFFVEFHRAKSSEVSKVLAKKQWLEEWMCGKPVDRLRPRQFVWLSAGGISIPPNAPQRRRLSAHGIVLQRRLQLR